MSLGLRRGDIYLCMVLFKAYSFLEHFMQLLPSKQSSLRWSGVHNKDSGFE